MLLSRGYHWVPPSLQYCVIVSESESYVYAGRLETYPSKPELESRSLSFLIILVKSRREDRMKLGR